MCESSRCGGCRPPLPFRLLRVSPPTPSLSLPPHGHHNNRKLQSVLGVEFDKLREKLTEMATTATDSDPFEALAILTVMQQSLTTLTLASSAGAGAASSSPPASPPSSSHRRSPSSPSSPSRHRIFAAFFNAGRVAGAAGTGGGGNDDSSFLASMLDQLQHTLEQRLAKFVGEQEQWVLHQQPDVKRAGVLAPFAKFPVFVDRLALVRLCMRACHLDRDSESVYACCVSVMPAVHACPCIVVLLQGHRTDEHNRTHTRRIHPSCIRPCVAALPDWPTPRSPGSRPRCSGGWRRLRSETPRYKN